jgi:two-component system NarL family sensor kinase
MKTKLLLLILLIPFSYCSLAQNQKKIDSLLVAGQKMKLDSNKVKNLLQLSEQYRGKNNQKAKELSFEAIKLGQKIKWVAHYPELFLSMIKVNNTMSNYAENILILDSTFKYTGKRSDCVCYTAEYYIQYLLSHSYSRNYDKAYEYGIKGLKLAEETKNYNQIARANLRLGEVKQNLNDYEGAIKNYEKSIELCKKYNFESILNQNRWMLAKVFITIDQYNKAYILQKEMTASYRKLKDSTQLAGALNAIAFGHIKNFRYKEAKGYLEEAYKIAQKVNNKYFLQYICIGLGKSYMSENKIEVAKKYIDEGFKIANELNDKDALTTLTSDLAHYYFVIRDFPKAFYTEAEIGKIYGDARSKQVISSVSDAETKYQTEKKERLILEQQLQISKQRNWIFGVIGIALVAILGSLLFYTKHQAKQKAQFAAEKLRLQTEKTSAIVEAEEKERIRLAKELHDGVGPLLSIAKFQLENAMKQTKFISIEQETLFQNTNNMIDDAAREIRTVSHDLMPNALLMQGLVSAVRDFVNRLSLSGKVKVSLDVANLDERLPQLTETVLYRVLQELVGNVIKHSDASSVQIQLIRHENELTMMVEDNGKGFETSQMPIFKGIGLKNIISRIDFLNGKVNFDSSPNRGTTVIVEVPIA